MRLKAFWAALSAYSVIPVPQYEWEDDITKYLICFFPAVGIIIGLLQCGWIFLCSVFLISPVLYAVVAAVLPLLISGGIHMDGFMDTVDALASHQSTERKLEIMKDSHCGAFAVIYCGVYILLTLRLYHELFVNGIAGAMLPVFVLSRALSGLCAVNLPKARKDGMLSSMTGNTDRKGAILFLVLFAAAACVVMALWGPVSGLGGILFAVFWTLQYRRLAMKNFGGVTGDTAGFFLQLCELFALLGILVGGMLL